MSTDEPRCGIIIYVYNRISFSHEKEGNPIICDNMDEPGGHYAKWNKLDRQIQMCMVSFMRNLNKTKSNS